MKLKVNKESLVMELDTGAAVSLMSKSTFRQLFPEAKLTPSNVLLKTYTNEVMSVVGEMPVEVEYGKQTKLLSLVVVAGHGPNLMGRDWLEQIQLDWKKIGTVVMESQTPISVEQLCEKYQNIFTEELGTSLSQGATHSAGWSHTQIPQGPDSSLQYSSSRRRGNSSLGVPRNYGTCQL